MDLDSNYRNQRQALNGALSASHQHLDAVRLLCEQRPRSDSASGRLNSHSQHKPKHCMDPGLDPEMYDTFEQCLHVTNHMDSVMAYHYQDENNKDCYRFEELFTFREGDIDISNLLSDTDQSAAGASGGLSQARSLSLQNCHLKEDLEEFIGQRSDVLVKETLHSEDS